MTRRSGFSLTESALAMALFGTLLAGCFFAMMGSVRTSKRSSDLLAEGILAQLVVRRMRDAILTNPKYIENLENKYGFKRIGDGRYESLGTTVAHSDPVQTPDGPINQSTILAEAMGASMAGATSPDGALLTDVERRAVLDSIDNLAVRVTLTDGARRTDFLGQTYNDDKLKELIKQVDVQVYWIGAEPGASWAPAYQIQDQVLTPVESLTVPALQQLQVAFDNLDLNPSVQEIKTLLAGKEAFQRYDNETREICARIFFIYREANVEAFLTQGKSVSVKNAHNGMSSDEQIHELAGQTAPYLQRKMAQAYTRKAQLIFDAYRKMKVALAELEAMHTKFEAQVRTANTTLEDLLGRVYKDSRDVQLPGSVPRLVQLVDDVCEVAKGYEQYITTNGQMIQKALLFEFLVNEPRTAIALNRLAHYPARFKDSLRQAANIYAAIATNPQATWLSRADATTQWVETCTALQMLADAGSTPGIPGKLAQLAAQWKDSIPYLADFMTQSDLSRAAIPELSARNPGFAAALPEFQSLETLQSPVIHIAGRYLPRAGMTCFLDDSGRVPVYLYIAGVGTGRGAGRLNMTRNDALPLIQKVNRALPPPFEQAVRLGLVSVAEILAPRLPGQTTRLARARGASYVNTGSKGPPPDGTTPPGPDPGPPVDAPSSVPSDPPTTGVTQ